MLHQNGQWHDLIIRDAHIMNLIGLIALALSIWAFAQTYHRLRPKPVKVRLATFFILALLSIPSVLSGIYYLHILPEWAWFYTFRSWRGTELLAVFLGGAAGAFATLLPRFLLSLPLTAAVGLGSVPYLKPLAGSLSDDVFQDKWKENACLQSTSSTCGPASVSTILRRLGVQASEKEVARAAFSYSGGTEAWYLARYVRRRGLKAKFYFSNTFSSSVGFPCLVGVRLGEAGHFIAVSEVNEDWVTFADPLVGEDRVSLSEFRRLYQFTGFHMVVEKPVTNATH